MTNRICTVPGCPEITDSGRCATHRREARRARGTTTDQGLGWQHQQRRDQLLLDAIGTPCPDCGTMMTDPAHMVADHSDPRSTGARKPADRVHCRRCSDRQGGRLSRQAQA